MKAGDDLSAVFVAKEPFSLFPSYCFIFKLQVIRKYLFCRQALLSKIFKHMNSLNGFKQMLKVRPVLKFIAKSGHNVFFLVCFYTQYISVEIYFS